MGVFTWFVQMFSNVFNKVFGLTVAAAANSISNDAIAYADAVKQVNDDMKDNIFKKIICTLPGTGGVCESADDVFKQMDALTTNFTQNVVPTFRDKIVANIKALAIFSLFSAAALIVGLIMFL